MKKINLRKIPENYLRDKTMFFKDYPSWKTFYDFLNTLILWILQAEVLMVPSCSHTVWLEPEYCDKLLNSEREFFQIGEPRPIKIEGDGWWLFATTCSDGLPKLSENTFLFATVQDLWTFVEKSKMLKGLVVNPQLENSLKLDRVFLEYLFIQIGRAQSLMED